MRCEQAHAHAQSITTPLQVHSLNVCVGDWTAGYWASTSFKKVGPRRYYHEFNLERSGALFTDCRREDLRNIFML